VGADHYWDLIGDNIMRGDEPTAIEAALLFQQQWDNFSPVSSVMILTTSPVEFNLEQIWNLEFMGITSTDDSLENNTLPS